MRIQLRTAKYLNITGHNNRDIQRTCRLRRTNRHTETWVTLSFIHFDQKLIFYSRLSMYSFYNTVGDKTYNIIILLEHTV